MVTVLRINLINLINVYRMLHNHDNEVFSYYSDFKESFFKYVIKRQCHYVIKNDSIIGLLFFNRKSKEIFYIPIIRDSISLFRLIYILNTNFSLKDYVLSITHKKLNAKLYKSYFPVDIFENYKYMNLDIKKAIYNSIDMHEDINVRKMLIDKEEAIRVKLQNDIFGNAPGRRSLTLLEVYSEERKSSFLKEMCFILDVQGEPCGYGQILINDDEYFLVNFGVVNEYRNKGYGMYFLSKIIESCSLSGISSLNLCVDSDNPSAINLYKKLGFKELYSKFSLKFKQ